MRQEGYYWVKRKGAWYVAEWAANCWYLTGDGRMLNDNYFEEINENRIVYDNNANV